MSGWHVFVVALVFAMGLLGVLGLAAIAAGLTYGWGAENGSSRRHVGNAVSAGGAVLLLAAGVVAWWLITAGAEA